MCSQSDIPPYDPPEPQPPRSYVLSGGARPVEEPRGSVALAVLGEMLQEAEAEYDGASAEAKVHAAGRADALLEARDRVAAVEAQTTAPCREDEAYAAGRLAGFEEGTAAAEAAL